MIRLIHHHRCCKTPAARDGFSLLEIIIATAILAASSMVLISLLGLGTKYGNRAEERSLVAVQAQSLLDEFLVSSSSQSIERSGEAEQERTGILPGLPSHGYRLTTAPFSDGLTLIKVEVYESPEPNTDEAPLLELTQLIRNSLLSPNTASSTIPVRDPFQCTD